MASRRCYLCLRDLHLGKFVKSISHLGTRLKRRRVGSCLEGHFQDARQKLEVVDLLLVGPAEALCNTSSRSGRVPN